MSVAPETDLANFLITSTLATVLGTDIWDCAEGELSDLETPARAIFVSPYGGPAAQPYLSGTHRKRWKQYAVQILVRGQHNTVAATLDRARSINDAVDCAVISGYDGVYTQQSDPVRIPQAPTDLPRFTVNVLLGRAV